VALRKALIVASLFAARLTAQSSAYLVEDINVSVAPTTKSSSPANFVRLGSRILFAATTTDAGAELWSTDGTLGGTSMVRDIMPGSGSSSPRNFAAMSGSLLFAASDGRGDELWTTDGTAKGTRLIADICAGSCSSEPRPLFVLGNELLFSANNYILGRELWITDGTPVGTRLFKDLGPGTTSSSPSDFAVLNDVVYFSAGALWKTDGTPGGTVKVTNQSAYSLRVAGSRLFFPSSTADSGQELWVSDGTEAGTRMIRDIRPGANGSIDGSSLTSFGDRALFMANDGIHGIEPWITDGTEAGTHALRDIDPGLGNGSSLYQAFIVVGELAYFTATDANGPELWRTDGTEAGTFLVRDIVPGKEGSNPSSLTAMGGELFFLVHAFYQSRLWVTDGTAAGTRPVRTSDASVSVAGNPSDYFSVVSPLTPIDGTLYFSAQTLTTGLEPWKSDGTEAGTAMIANLGTDAAANSNPDALVAAGDLLFFRAWDGSGALNEANDGPRSLWRSDGTAEGTVKLLPAVSDSFVAAGRSIFFKGSDGQLWRSDGTPSGTGPATELAQRFPGTFNIVYAAGDRLFVNVVRNGQSELWSTTTAPNAPATALGTSTGTKFSEFAGRTVFFNDSKLWISDGTPAGTHVVLPLTAQTPSPWITYPAPTPAGPIAAMGGNVYFALRAIEGVALWKSDGTTEGTVPVGALPGDVDAMVPAGRKLFILAAGTLSVMDGSEIRWVGLAGGPLGTVGDRVVFASRPYTRETSNLSQLELWISDGTEEGTYELRDIEPGVKGSNPDDFVSVAGIVYFTATNAAGGRELWSTDGTPEGTTLVTDIEPGPRSSSPRQLRRAGNHLFFVATTAATGVELWAVTPGAAPLISIGDTRVSEAGGGSTARFVVTLSPASAQTVKVGFATSDGTAVGGADYDPAFGTLAFAPGERSKTIDVAVRDDAEMESNESFFVTLGHADGAAVMKPAAFAVIEDDEEQVADLSASLDLSRWWNDSNVVIIAANSGPGIATEVKVARTMTPANVGATECQTCPMAIQLAPGRTARAALTNLSIGSQQYHTATVTSRQRDPQPSNNSVVWMTNYGLTMDALFLTPGAQATAWAIVYGTTPTVSVESSNPSVISVPSSLANTPGEALKFTVLGIGAGKATIRVFAGKVTYGTLDVDVVTAGAKPRFRGGIAPRLNATPRLDQPAVFDIYLAKAPFSGSTATGVVTISIGSRELERLTLAPGETRRTFSTYLPARGAHEVRFDYSGDDNFLPQTVTARAEVLQGKATILGSATRSGNSATIHVRVTGSPLVSPSGTIYIHESPYEQSQPITLRPGATGDAEADLTIANVAPEWRVLTVVYSGDANYAGGSQDIGIRGTSGRAAGRR
jgi:ELWxxDGT repeat protein